MRDRPLCKKCGGHHYNFVACDQADQVNAAEDATDKANAEQQAVQAARLGHVNQFSGAKSNTHNIVYVPGEPVVMWRKRPGQDRWRTG